MNKNCKYLSAFFKKMKRTTRSKPNGVLPYLLYHVTSVAIEDIQ